MKILSIIVPMYNVEAYIEECINSLVHQDISSDEYEIVVVDDGSPDQSAQKVRILMEKHRQIRMIHQENQGLSQARNHGLAEAEGQFVWFVDSDDTIRENCLNELISCISREDAKMMRIGGKWESLPERGNSYPKGWMSREVAIAGNGREVCVPLYIYRRDFLVNNRLNMKAGIYHEDSEFQPRAIYKAERIYGYDGYPVYYVRENPESITHNKLKKRTKDVVGICKNEWNELHRGEWKNADRAWKRAIKTHIKTTLHSIIRSWIR